MRTSKIILLKSNKKISYILLLKILKPCWLIKRGNKYYWTEKNKKYLFYKKIYLDIM